MNIFLDTLSKRSALMLFDDDREILKLKYFDVHGDEWDKLVLIFDDFLRENDLTYSDIKNIAVVVWPGSFTGIRITTIMVNTIAFTLNTKLTPITYFELFKNYPIIKKSSKRDSFVQKIWDGDIEVVENTEISKIFNRGIIFWDLELDDITTNSEINYREIIENLELRDLKIVKPFYIKKPSVY